MRWIEWMKRNGVMAAVILALFILSAVLVEKGSSVLAASRSGDEPVADENVMVLRSGNAWLGVRLAEVTPEKAAELKLREEAGALVTQVEEGSPAAKAGLRANDVIVQCQGQRVESAAQLQRMVRETPAGRTVRLEVSRNGQRQSLTAQLAAREWPHGEIRIPEIHVPPMHMPDINIQVLAPHPRLGISADALTPQLAEYFGVKQGKGVLVSEVNEGSPAAKAGLKAGDVIVRVDETTVGDVGDLREALRKKKGGDTVTLTVIRQRAEQTLKVQLEENRPSPRRSASAWSADDLLRDYRDSVEHLRPELEALRENLKQELGEKQRDLQQELKRVQQELELLRDRLTI